ncbi:adenylosuccinate synthase [Paenibacillus sp. VTT E-133280]|jgi:adenylosuccinate synthase|uniref:Adenylosuccinate synthetase n=1 Tax=Paenibacillus etheri TaxID=1306852 RepID=A0A0W1AS92_9BACL|nr:MULTISPECIES: adenylosuccinate synthase [Paenibacillus]KAA1188067.1 adenylosuccinate synthase [Paenibacillus sp. B2(2019)]KTD84209.1 adenylosuccinate synthetase [Paenibacillus etheri]MDH6372606.1 adenylosuccinate synthase [Paenibacillus sp. PastF-3]OZQ67659.1 adenylosuccinate synthase [Paenibacillus sp. VTT E-133280]OZQ91955.1 adenylosuccinate synthase [Paenibacillus sp. VTT E-133291]
MSTVVVVGTQWGDEGKGKITDFLAESADVVARYQGGNNAGHTILIDGEKFKLSLIPSGVFYKEKTCVIGNGMVINPAALIQEINYIHENGFDTKNLVISDRAHVIMPYHMVLDALEEDRKGPNKIGTTRKGIGPCYMDKAARNGIRIADLMDAEEFELRLRHLMEEKNQVITQVYGAEALDVEEILTQYLEYAEVLRNYVTDTSVILNEAIDADRKVLFEGAQGVMLDIDQGTYPFVTSSNPSAGGVCIGSGVGPSKIKQVIGVAKAYTTRVGDGPFPTELNDATGDYIRETGHEYGTVTGRARRVGWFDSVVVSHARRVSGITGLSLNSLDVLSGLETVKICTGYKYRGEVITHYPASLKMLAECEAVYEELPGWSEDITSAKTLDDLPANTRRYVERVSELTGIPIAIFSVGRNREQTNQVTPIYI